MIERTKNRTPGGATERAEPATTDAAPATNRVALEGRLSSAPESRTLPSGDSLVLLRVVVPRPGGRGADSLP
ncbi:MAG: single-stranded DNA-binding protein, partial [Nitriliruptorales bacterium]